METVLIAGIDTVVGANLAAVLSQHFRVVGLTPLKGVIVDGCETCIVATDDREEVRHRVASVQPDWIVNCPIATAASWQLPQRQIPKPSDVRMARCWAQTATDFGCRLTLVSSDAVFSGPWMFHAERSTCLCPSREAETIRAMESVTRQTCPNALVVRTHAFGWTPAAVGFGWIEHILAELESAAAPTYDHIRHATPILATDLAEALALAYRKRLDGVYHIAGGERVNPAQFVQRLAEQFQLPAPGLGVVGSLADRPVGFGCGETSLQTGKIRGELGVSMPLLSDGLRRLYQQAGDGFRDRLAVNRQTVGDMVA